MGRYKMTPDKHALVKQDVFSNGVFLSGDEFYKLIKMSHVNRRRFYQTKAAEYKKVAMVARRMTGGNEDETTYSFAAGSSVR